LAFGVRSVVPVVASDAVRWGRVAAIPSRRANRVAAGDRESRIVETDT